MDRDRPAADSAGQPSDGIGVGAVKAVGDAQDPRKPFYQFTLAGVERREAPVTGFVWKGLGVISGHKGADQLILIVEPGDVEVQDHVTAQFVVLARNHSRPADIM
jgi:hypothetical protein